MPSPATQVFRYPLALRLLAIWISALLLPPFPAAAAKMDMPAGVPIIQRLAALRTLPAAALPQQTPAAKLACDALDDSTQVQPNVRNSAADELGDISIAQPKIWQFERMSALLDGLLRDIEGVSLGDLTQLNPNQQNAAALTFVQSALEVGVQYDQAAAVNAANTLNEYNAIHQSQIQQLNAYNNYMQTLTAERNRLAAQNSAATNTVDILTALQAEGPPLTPDQDKKLLQAQTLQSSTQTALDNINKQITSAGAAPTLTAPPTVTGTSVQGPASGSSMSSSLMGFSDVLKALPQGVQNNLSNSLQSPTFPASKQLDNFITLLYERLAQQISAMQDDLTRDPENVPFFMQFDVGLYPSKRAKEHVARVEFNLDCPGCKVYALYPGQSAYNLANFTGSSKRNSFWGNILTLFGLGISGSYRRQVDTLQGGLVQSVYTAGFQNGTLPDKYLLKDQSMNSSSEIPANKAEQSFGWYYGAAPLERFVSPGIRRTFALVTVPRQLIEDASDQFGEANACIPFRINGSWVNRNDPLRQDHSVSIVGELAKLAASPAYFSYPVTMDHSGDNVQSEADLRFDTTVITRKTSVKLPGPSEELSLVALREPKKLHVLRMEYNTVFEESTGSPPAGSIQTTTQSTVQTSGPAASQNSAQTTTTTTAVGNSSATGAATPGGGQGPLACPKGQCATVLIKLDRPIDPNLVVTVRGVPLKRVRDWRGRATSVLPPAQSGTDLVAGSNGAPNPLMNQVMTSRGLTESDHFGANTWIALNSHELLINVSVDVATDEDFPVIQLADPGTTLVLPYDVDSSITQLIVNGFRLRPQTAADIQKSIATKSWSLASDGTKSITKRREDTPISSGPYAFSTYAPLFSPEPVPRSIFAFVGEVGDLLIGFLPAGTGPCGGERTSCVSWKEGQVQVILEDRDLDFAWSLTCDAQSDLLACTLPRDQIASAYFNLLRACKMQGDCPNRDEGMRPLRRSQALTRTSGANLTDLSSKTVKPTVKEWNEAFVTTLQVWVEQFDPDGRDAIYSPTPVRVDFLPVSDDYYSGDNQKPFFRDWHFLRASPNRTWIEECSFQPLKGEVGTDGLRVALLGGRLPFSLDALQIDKDVADTEKAGCASRAMPTDFLSKFHRGQIVLVAQFSPVPGIDPVRATLTVPGYRVGPLFEKPLIALPASPSGSAAGKSPSEKTWKLSFPVSQTTCADNIDFLFPPPGKPVAADAGGQGPAESPKPPQKKKPGGQKPQIGEDESVLRDPADTPRFLNASLNSEVPPAQTPGQAAPKAASTPGQKPAPNQKPPAAAKPAAPAPARLVPPAPADQPAEITVSWMNGQKPLTQCLNDPLDQNTGEPAGMPDWRKADEAGLIRLELTIPQAAIATLPKDLEVERHTSDGLAFPVALVPDLRAALLPSRLKLDSLSSTQFTLSGSNAGAINAVALQGGKNNYVLQAAGGPTFVLVTLSSSSAKADTSSAGTKPVISSLSLDSTGRQITISGKNFGDSKGQIRLYGLSKPPVNQSTIPVWNGTTITLTLPVTVKLGDTLNVLVDTAPVTSDVRTFIAGQSLSADCTNASASKPCISGIAQDDSKTQIIISGKNFGDPRGMVSLDGHPAPGNYTWTSSSVTLPFHATVGSMHQISIATAPEESDLTLYSVGTNPAGSKSGSDSSGSGQSSGIAAGTYIVVPLLQTGGSGNSATYMPMEVTDLYGKPLLFTVPDTSKQTTTPATTPATTTCSFPCLTTTCPVSCTTTPAAATPASKSP